MTPRTHHTEQTAEAANEPRTAPKARVRSLEIQERRVILVSELVALHKRMASMLKVILLREGHEPVRAVLGRQRAIDLHIADRLLHEAKAHGIRPCPIAQEEVTALLEEVRYADHDHSDPAKRPAALRRALGAVRQHAIRCWSRLMDVTDEPPLTQLKDEALSLQWMEADLYRSLASLTTKGTQQGA
ncbi:MAG: hypothetical protein ACO1NQ_13975 [Flavobacteriales bacterium]